MNWNDYFMTIAKATALRSKDPKHKVGAVIVDKDNRICSTGYNGMPRLDGPRNNDSLDIIDWDNKKHKEMCIHAEMNALIFVRGEPFKVYCTMEPCLDCLKHMIQRGIREVYFLEPMSVKWKTAIWKKFFKTYCIYSTDKEVSKMITLYQYKEKT